MLRHFSADDGLPDLKVECLFEDRTGIVWVGTHDQGLACWKEDRFVPFSCGPTRIKGAVFSILQGGDGVLWFATDAGLRRYDGSSVTVVDGPEGGGFLWGSAKDHEGRLWFGMGRRPGLPPAVAMWDGHELSVVSLDEEGTDKGRSIHAVAVDSAGRVWCAGDGVYRQDGGRFAAVSMPEVDGQVLVLLPRSNGEMWCVAQNGLVVRGRSGARRAADPTAKSRQRDAHVGELCAGREGRVWATTNDGWLLCFDADGLCLSQEVGAPFWRGLVQDRAGRIWAGSYGDGVYCYDPTRFLRPTAALSTGISGVRCLVEQPAGPLWVGAKQGLFAARGGDFQCVERLAGEEITALLADSAKRLWIATLGGRLLVRGPAGLDHVWGETNSDAVFALAEDARGRIWFGAGLGSGLRYWAQGEVRTVPMPHESETPVRVGALAIDARGQVWIGVLPVGSQPSLCVWSEDEETVRAVRGVSGVAVHALCAGAQGRLWCGTSDGLYLVEGERCAQVASAEAGLPFGIVTALCEDQRGTLWIGTEGGGLCRYDGQVLQSLRIPLGSRYNVIRAICQDGEGRFWLGTEGGLLRYVPGQAAPVVEVEAVEADGHPVPTEDASIPATVERVTVRFRGRTSLGTQADVVYQTKLARYEAEWHTSRTGRRDYERLPAGRYTFAVRAVDADLNYSKPTSVPLHVRRRYSRRQASAAATVLGSLVGRSAAWQRVLDELQREAVRSDLPVLLIGEAGTGKATVARAIHQLSAQSSGPFRHVQCGGLSEGLVLAQLLGPEGDAPSAAGGAPRSTPAEADYGTLFVDAVEAAGERVQAALLQLLREQDLQRDGSEQPVRRAARVVAATSRDLWAEADQGRFSVELCRRLHVWPILLPALRERLEDVPLLAEQCVAETARRIGVRTPEIPRETRARLLGYPWPGNVAELESVVQRAVVLAGTGPIEPFHVALPTARTGKRAAAEGPQAFLSMEEMEKRYLCEILRHAKGKVYGPGGAAEIARVHPDTLSYRIKKLGLRG
ncbi:MAG: two-component regulator propeller domain-containing protein [Candidatus Latescibacterota bacterium]